MKDRPIDQQLDAKTAFPPLTLPFPIPLLPPGKLFPLKYRRAGLSRILTLV